LRAAAPGAASCAAARQDKFLAIPETFALPPCIECGQPALPVLDNCIACSIGRNPLDGRPRTIPILVDPIDQLVLAADSGGHLRDVRAAISPAALAALATPHRLVAATDPLPAGERGATRPVALLTSLLGNQVIETLHGGGRTLGTLRDLPGGQTEVPSARAAQATPSTSNLTTSSAASSTTAAPPASKSFVATYSRKQGEMFVVAGKEGRRAGSVWAFHVDTNEWTELPLRGGLTPEKPLASVFLPASNTLWVLDEQRVGFFAVARLWRIDRATGVTKLVSSVPRLGLYESQHLLEDRDGRLLLVASSKLLKNHVILSLSQDGKVVAAGVGASALAAPPQVDSEAYTFFLLGKKGVSTITSMPVLPLHPGSRPEASRCF
jgi:hypothetical protein